MCFCASYNGFVRKTKGLYAEDRPSVVFKARSDAAKQKEAVLPARTDSPDLNLNMRGKTVLK